MVLDFETEQAIRTPTLLKRYTHRVTEKMFTSLTRVYKNYDFRGGMVHHTHLHAMHLGSADLHTCRGVGKGRINCLKIIAKGERESVCVCVKERKREEEEGKNNIPDSITTSRSFCRAYIFKLVREEKRHLLK